MPSEEEMCAVVRAYVDNYNAEDLDGLVSLFAAEAQVEDPVGTPIKSGHAAIREFFGVGIAAGARLHLDGPIRAVSNFAAFPFHVTLEWDGAQTRIDVIDTFEFDDDGKVSKMRAFFGAANQVSSKGVS